MPLMFRPEPHKTKCQPPWQLVAARGKDPATLLWTEGARERDVLFVFSFVARVVAKIEEL